MRQLVTRPRYPYGAHLVTLCRFDDKYGPKALLGPFIPCERRLAQVRISGIQGRGLSTGFLEQGVWQASCTYLDDTLVL